MPNNSPNMNLPIPIIGVDTGLVWEQSIATALTLLDQHNHTPGFGVPIPSTGLNIDTDLSFQGNGATNLNLLSFAGAISGTPGILSEYTDGTDLYFKDSAGNSVQLTKNGSPNAGTGNIQGLPSTPTGGAGISWVNSASTFEFLQDDGTTGATLDLGTLVLRYPGSYPTPSGNFIALQAPAALATGYHVTLPATLPASTQLLQMGTSGIVSYVSAIPSVQASTTANNFNYNATTAAPVHASALDTTFSAHGTPVFITLAVTCRGLSSDTFVPTGSQAGYVLLKRDGAIVANATLAFQAVVQGQSSVVLFNMTDVPPAGSHTYSLYLVYAQLNLGTGLAAATLAFSST